MRSFSRSSLVLLILIGGIFTRQAFSQTNKPAMVFPTLPPETKAFLIGADEFTLFSLDPSEHKSRSAFHDHRVIGGTRIGADAERTRLVNGLEKGIADGRDILFCFNPRHGIRAKKDGRVIDCLICFECRSVYIYSESTTNGFFTTASPRNIFDLSLTIHNVQVADE